MQPSNVLQQMSHAPFAINDPGDAGYVAIDRNFFYLPIVSAGAETRILNAPPCAGLTGRIGMTTYVGAVTVTVKDSAASTTGTIIFNTAGDWAELISIETSLGVFAWRYLGTSGTTNTVPGAADSAVYTDLSQTLTSKTLTAPTINSPVVTESMGASTSAAGSTSADATSLPAGTARVYATTSATDATGVIIHASDKVTGRMLYIGNGVYNKILKVYPAAGGTINGASANAAFSTASGQGAIVVCTSSGSNTWLAW